MRTCKNKLKEFYRKIPQFQVQAKQSFLWTVNTWKSTSQQDLDHHSRSIDSNVNPQPLTKHIQDDRWSLQKREIRKWSGETEYIMIKNLVLLVIIHKTEFPVEKYVTNKVLTSRRAVKIIKFTKQWLNKQTYQGSQSLVIWWRKKGNHSIYIILL